MKRELLIAAALLSLAQNAAAQDAAQAKLLAAKYLGESERDLVFIPITPCTVWDTRFATDPGAAGMINNGNTKRFLSHLDGAGSSYAAYGGNPSCPETAQNAIGMRPYAVMMTVYTNDASANGWLTLYRDGDPDPSSATISVYYSPGPTRTQTVISKSSRGYGSGSYDIAATSRFGNVNASAAITGYFLKVTDGQLANLSLSGNLVLQNTTSATTGVIAKGGSSFAHNFGGHNTFLGHEAGNFTLGGEQNTGLGRLSLGALTTGSGNVAVGASSLVQTTTGDFNIAMGYAALQSNTSGEANVGVGFAALANAATTNGNVAIGHLSLVSTSAGSNTAVGAYALQLATSGTYNIALGYDAGGEIVTGSNNIAIGHLGTTGESNTTRLGSTQNRAFIAGVRNVTTGGSGAVAVLIDSQGQLGTISSSAAVKDAIADMAAASHDLMKLRPVTFHYRQHGSGGALQYGLIAEEVEKVYPGLVTHNADGSAETVMYQHLPPMLLNEVQKHERTIAELKARIEQLEKLMEARR